MKLLLIGLISLASTTLLAQDYITTPDGSSKYVGSCALHMDYVGYGLEKGSVVQEYFEPSYRLSSEEILAAWDKLPKITQTLMSDVGSEIGEELNTIELFEYFDDFEIFKLNLKFYNAPVNSVYVVSYGVGGGNGGYNFYEMNEDGDFIKVAASFDGDQNFCDEDYIFKK